jgi:segregation and condensation protein A
MYKFVINDFEGPMDLLLHLVHQNNIEIYDINLVSLVNQYLDFINEMEKLELNIASEYIVMAAELIELKSRALLPKPATEEVLEDDPREELIDRLLEYKKYKEVTSDFKELEKTRKEYYSKEPSSLKDYIKKNEETADISLLLAAFNDFMNRKASEHIVTKTTTKEYSIEERRREIKDILFKKKKVEFIELFTIKSRDYIIVTFLSLLEMAKSNEISLIQNSNFDKLYIIGGTDESSN